jgi:hypothetical protein
LEREETTLRIAEALAALHLQLGISICFKASFDKANRSRLAGARGPGLEEGLRTLERVRAQTGLPVLTDVHAAAQASAAAQVVDALQIPAFLCRQTDLLVAAGKTGKPVNTSLSGAPSLATATWSWTCEISPVSARQLGLQSCSMRPMPCNGQALGPRERAAESERRSHLYSRRRRRQAPTGSFSRLILTRPRR